MSKIACVTGGAGFIGSHIVDKCLELGYEVKVIDDFSTGDRRNLDEVSDQIDVHEVDVRDVEPLDRILSDVDVVFHQAALPSVPRSIEAPVKSTEITLMGTLKLMDVARKNGVQKIVYASSSSVYGNRETLPQVEDMREDPRSPYAAAKMSCEKFASAFTENFALPTVGLRYFNVFGPRQDPNSDYAAVIPNFIRAILSDRSPVIFGDGEQSRDFTFVKDAVNANIEAMQSGKSGAVYNVGYDQQTTINELVDKLNTIVGKSIEPDYDEPRPGDVRHSRADVDAITSDTGFTPSFDFDEGLRRTVEWFKNNSNRWDEPKYET